MRLIDADELKAKWYKINDIGAQDCGARFVGYQEIARFIDNAPTIEPSGDLISRHDAIEVVGKELQHQEENRIPYDSHDNGTCFGLKKAKELLLALPSADTCDRPKGEWLYLENEPYSKCSVCGAYIDDLDDEKFNYCPCCGAEMRKKE